jgi:hypothetical protein
VVDRALCRRFEGRIAGAGIGFAHDHASQAVVIAHAEPAVGRLLGKQVLQPAIDMLGIEADLPLVRFTGMQQGQ